MELIRFKKRNTMLIGIDVSNTVRTAILTVLLSGFKRNTLMVFSTTFCTRMNAGVVSEPRVRKYSRWNSYFSAMMRWMYGDVIFVFWAVSSGAPLYAPK